MIFPLEDLIEFKDNIYEITSAASERSLQLSKLNDETVKECNGKVVSLAAKQLFTKQVVYRIDEQE